MADGLVDSAAQATAPDDQRIYGVVSAEVVANCDQTNRGRVKVRLPWLPGYEPWARVAAAMAGKNCGAFFMPQVGDEVLVAFNHGDVRQAYIVGSMWNGENNTPVEKSSDAESMWVLRTPKGHEIRFDDKAETIAITHANGDPHVKLTRDKIEIAVDKKNSASITWDQKGTLKLEATSSIELNAPSIKIKASQSLELSSKIVAELDGGAQCTIKGIKIDIAP